jgi:hypothetical protein
MWGRILTTARQEARPILRQTIVKGGGCDILPGDDLFGDDLPGDDVRTNCRRAVGIWLEHPLL